MNVGLRHNSMKVTLRIAVPKEHLTKSFCNVVISIINELEKFTFKRGRFLIGLKPFVVV